MRLTIAKTASAWKQNMLGENEKLLVRKSHFAEQVINASPNTHANEYV